MVVYAINRKDYFDKSYLMVNKSYDLLFAKMSSIDSIRGELLVRYAIFKEYGLRVKDQIYFRSATGKPQITNLNKEFSISHSGDWIVCVISDKKVGIDIESNNRVRLNIARRFFHEKEKNYIFIDDEYIKAKRFLEIWTKKESLLKMVGIGLRCKMSSFCVVPSREISKFRKVLYYVVTINCFARHTLSICSCAQIESVKIKIINKEMYLEVVE